MTLDPMLLDLPMPILTERLSLRPLQAGDGPMLFAAIETSKSELEKYLLWPPFVKCVQDSEKFARKSKADFILRRSMNLAIFKDNDFIGVCGFNYFVWERYAAEIGYWRNFAYPAKDYMREAIEALVNYGAKHLGLRRIVITCLDDNEKSAALAEKLDFQLETKALGLVKSPHTDDLAMCARYVRFMS